MKKIRLGIVGLGQRGSMMVDTFLAIPNVDITAICDVYQDRNEAAVKKIKNCRDNEVFTYCDFNEFIKERKFDAVYIATSWEEHINQSIICMENNIPVGMEVGGAYSIDDCWKLVDTYEKTHTPIMMLENCCYDRFETLITNLIRKGLFGEIIHCHGAYSHDLREEITGGNINRHYRLRNYINRNCENYPTHELGPLAKILHINNGNRFVSMVSFSSKARGLEEFTKDERCIDKSLVGTKFKQGDIISTIIKCENGETITLTLDTTLPGYYSRQIVIKGTKGCANQEANMVLIDSGGAHMYETTETITKNLNNATKYNEYLPDYWKTITEEEKRLGHGGMDLYMVKTFIDCLINNKKMPIDVYDAAAWYSITPLSEKSIEEGKILEVPDFTRGKYKNRKFVEAFK